MRYALSSARMSRAEERTVTSAGAAFASLMERAGGEIAHHALSLDSAGIVVVLVGRGNNGGDGCVAARRLHGAGRQVTLVAPAGTPVSSPAADAAEAAIGAGVPWRDGVEGLPELLQDASLVVDALLGFGASGAVREPLVSAIRAMNAASCPVLSVDIPSGVDSDTGVVLGDAVRADCTITFSAAKPGLLLQPGASLAGEVRVSDIGVPRSLLGDVGDLEVWDEADYSARVRLPEPDSHKNSRGRVLVVAGSGAYPGAAALVAMGAQRAGAGFVTLAAPEAAAAVANAILPSVVVVPLPENPSHTLASKAADAVMDLAAEHDSVVIGPGLTLAHGAVLVSRTIVTHVGRPLVVDADALNALVDATGLLGGRTDRTVITPHPGELARLLGLGTKEIQGDRLSYGAKLARGNVTCVLKGAATVISGAGRQVIDTVGTPALAHAGTGDVLAGVIGTLLAQGADGLDAAALGAYLHGSAGRLAAEAGSELSVIAEDVAAFLPAALRQLVGR